MPRERPKKWQKDKNKQTNKQTNKTKKTYLPGFFLKSEFIEMNHFKGKSSVDLVPVNNAVQPSSPYLQNFFVFPNGNSAPLQRPLPILHSLVPRLLTPSDSLETTNWLSISFFIKVEFYNMCLFVSGFDHQT